MVHPVTEFGMDNTKSDKLRNYCRLYLSKRREIKRIEKLGLVDLGDHECPSCHIVKLTSEFYYTLSDASGVYELCKQCCTTPNGQLGEYGHAKKITIDGNTLHVHLTLGQIMDCDNSPEAWILLQQYNWCATEKDGKFYAACHRNNEHIEFHRLIMACHDDRIVDHWDRNTLNNRVVNLRIANEIINARNTTVRK